MKSDLPRLLEEAGADAVVCFCPGFFEPPAIYFGRMGASKGLLYVVTREDVYLFCSPLERDSAAAAGLKSVEWPELDLGETSGDSPVRVEAKRWIAALRRAGVPGGRVTLSGSLPLPGGIAAVVELLSGTGYELPPSGAADLVFEARRTKDREEIEIMTSVGARAAEVVDAVRAKIANCAADADGYLLTGGARLTLGDLRELSMIEGVKRGLLPVARTILSTGRDAAVPHNFGNDADCVRAGGVVLMDYFPRCAETGYCSDITRTWCVGGAAGDLVESYALLEECHSEAREHIAAGGSPVDTHRAVQELMEARGVPAGLKKPAGHEGFCHPLGHGVGFEIHEAPHLGRRDLPREDVFEVGNVFTIEPGIYFPDRGWGMRLEDTVALADEGLRTLTPAARDFVIEIGGG